MTDTQVQPDLDILEITTPYEDDNDPDHRTHVISPNMNKHISLGSNMSAKDIVDTARFLGVSIVALCGHRFIPKSNPEKYQPCQPCFKLATDIIKLEE